MTPEQLQGDQVASLAVPECGTKFVRGMLEDSRPQTFSDLVRISGFSHGTNVWLDNAQELIKNGTCKLNEAISTRDDVMNFLIHRGMNKKTVSSSWKMFVKGRVLKREINKAKRLRSLKKKCEKIIFLNGLLSLVKKISYLFPRAHAVAYVMMAFRIAWFKVYHPLAFYAAYFSIRAKAFDLRIMTGDLNTQLKEFNRIKALDRGASTVRKRI